MVSVSNHHAMLGSVRTIHESPWDDDTKLSHRPRILHSPIVSQATKIPTLAKASPSPSLELEFAEAAETFQENPEEYNLAHDSAQVQSIKQLMLNAEAQAQRHRAVSKKNSQYYEEIFAFREPRLSAQERISRDSVVIGDVRTNVIVKDEYTAITDISYLLSTRFQRPESSILVAITHSGCLLHSGSFEPAYIMTITALASQLLPVTNKRLAVLLQQAMEEILGVKPDRGVVTFIPIAEENLATNSKTLAGEIEDLEKERMEEVGIPRKSLSKATLQSKTVPSMKSMQNFKQKTQTRINDVWYRKPDVQDDWATEKLSQEGEARSQKTGSKNPKLSVKQLGRRQSFMATIFRRGL